jgi:hypothetical protein
VEAGSAITIPLFLLVLYVFVGLFARRAIYLFRLVLAGRASAGRLEDLPRRSVREVVGVLFQSKLFLRPIPGVMHLLLFWGFLDLLPTIVMSFLGAMDRHWAIPWLAEQGWFALFADLFAIGVLVGVSIAFTIRLGLRPVRFVGSYLKVAYTILLFEAAITLTLFAWHGSQIALGLNEYPAEWAPVSNLVAGILPGWLPLDVLERVVVWVHAVLILASSCTSPTRSTSTRSSCGSTCSSAGRAAAAALSHSSSTTRPCPRTRSGSAWARSAT